MKFVKVFKHGHDLWPRISLLLSISFLVLGGVLLILGNRLLGESTDHVLEQRLIISKMVANQLDRKLLSVVMELEEAVRFNNLNPMDSEINTETRVLDELYNDPYLLVAEVVILDASGMVVLANPPNHFTPGTNLAERFYFVESFEEGEICIAIPWKDPYDQNLLTAITIPIRNEEQVLTGWLSTVINLDESSILKLLEDAVVLDKSAHAILTDEQGRSLVSTFDLPFLSPGEHVTFYSRAISQGEPVVEEVSFELNLPNEPKGHHHIMAFAPLTIVPWGVFVGGDVVKETFAGPYRLYIWLASFFIISVFAIWGLTMVSTKRLLEPAKNTSLKFDIIQQLTNANSWDEMISLIVYFPSTIMPVSKVQLFMPDESGLNMISEWSSEGGASSRLRTPRKARVCEACALINSSTVRSITQCDQPEHGNPADKHNSFCLPLVHQNSLVGTLHFSIPSDASQTINKRFDILSDVASDIAVALEGAQLQRSNMNQIEITQTERRRIARKLHDTLGQNIGFLRIKLDQYSTMGDLVSTSEIHNDIVRMRDIANEAYEQIRGTLRDLHPETKTELATAIQSRATDVAKRANIDIDFVNDGKPLKLSSLVKSQVLFIAYEALNNIEKHSQAHKVYIHLLWGKDDLTVTIGDDGKGFDVDKATSEDQYGLDIMQERARVINGKLNIDSSPTGGTKIVLWIPL